MRMCVHLTPPASQLRGPFLRSTVLHPCITPRCPTSEVDGSSSPAALAGSRFGDCLLELGLPGGGWGLAAAFSPDGSSLAAASQGAEGSHLTILTGVDLSAPSSLDAAAIDAEAAAAAAGSGAPPRLQRLPLPSLPLKCLAFLSESVLAGGGFDCQPQLFARRADGCWQFARSLAGEGGQEAPCLLHACGMRGHAVGKICTLLPLHHCCRHPSMQQRRRAPGTGHVCSYQAI